jgi:hypothetical protein
MSPTTADTVDPQAVVFEADLLSPGDEVELERGDYEYSSPLEVTSVDLTRWLDGHGQVQFSTTRIELTTGYANSSAHIVEAVTGDYAEWKQGDHTDTVVTFAAKTPGDDSTDTNGDDQDEDEDAKFDAVDTDVESVKSARSDAMNHDPGEIDDSDLPDGVSVASVEDAVEDNEYLRGVADDLELPEGTARSVVFRLDLYTDVKEGGRYR